MNTDLFMRIVIIILMTGGFLYLVYPDIINIKKKNNIITNTNSVITNVSQEETFKELDNIINIFITDYIYVAKIGSKDIYMNSDLLNKVSEDVSTEVIVSLSDHFKNKLKLFFTEEAINKYITKQVIYLLLQYATKINTPS